MYQCKLRRQSSSLLPDFCQHHPDLRGASLCACSFFCFHTPEERGCKKEDTEPGLERRGKEGRSIPGRWTASASRTAARKTSPCCCSSVRCSQVQWVLNSSPSSLNFILLTIGATRELRTREPIPCFSRVPRDARKQILKINLCAWGGSPVGRVLSWYA